MFNPDYSRFFDNNKNLLCVVDKDGVFLWVNKAIGAVLGYNEENLLRRSFFDFFHPENTAIIHKIKADITAGKNISDILVQFQSNAGKYKTILWQLSADANTSNYYISGTEITKSEQKEALLDGALRIAKVGGWQLDVMTNDFTWTREMYDILGIPENTPLKLNDPEGCFPPSDWQTIMYHLNKAITEQESYDIEVRAINCGKTIWTRAVGRPIIENGKVVKIQGTFQDITEQKETELLIQENEAYIKTVTDSSPLGILVTDVYGNCTYTNNAYLEISGLTAQEALGNGWIKVVHPDERQVIAEKWAEAAEKGENLKLTTRYIRADDGRERLVNSQAASIFRNGELKGYVATVEDITEKHETEEKVRISEQRLRDAQRIANLSYWEYNLETEKLEWSEEAFEQLGLQTEEKARLTHEEYMRMVHPDDAEILLNSIENALKGGVPYEIELRYIAHNGEIHYARTKGVPVYENGELIKLTGTSLDITQQKMVELELVAAKEKAEEAMRAKAQFLSIMSHEIRTPLNAVIGLSYLLLQENPKPEQLENLRTLKFSSETLLALINDILDFSKIEAGKITFEQINFNLLETVNGIKHSLSLLAEEKGINLKFRRDEDLPEIIVGDPVRLSQILINLVSNAIKFTNAGNVTIDALVTKETETSVDIEFSVTDTGIGIDEKNIQRIFESFTQESGDTTRKFGGTGLGLSITKRLLELQSSSIHVESEKGKGSRFYFTLTFKKAKAAQRNANKYQPEVQGFASLENVKILLAEDNKVNQFVVAKFLKKWNIEVDIADNGKIAVEKVQQNYYDLVLMDLQMPEMDGYDATIAIRNLRGDNLPIIGLTATAADEITGSVLAAGMNDCVIKPFNPQELYNKITKYIPAEKLLPA